MNMSETSALVSGAFVLWDVGATDRERLAEKLTAIGMEKFCPPPRSVSAALKKGLADVAVCMKRDLAGDEKRDIIIEPHRKREDGFELVEVTRGRRDNYYQPRISAKVDVTQDGAVETVMVTKGALHLTEINERYARYRREVTGASVGRSLVDILEHLHGTCVRTIGGVYYLPEDAVDKWDDVVSAYEAAGPNTIHRIRIVMDQQAVRTVKRAITRELTSTAGAIAEEIRSGKLGEQALAKRLADAKALRDRAKKYEEILAVELAECHAVINLAEVAASSSQAIQEDDKVFDAIYESV
jgi:hypothetical protein